MRFMSELKPTQIDEKTDVKLKVSERANIEVVSYGKSEPTLVALQQPSLLQQPSMLQQPLASPDVRTSALEDIYFAPNYEVIELLGQGGMGTVYKVFDKALKTVFAIKVLRPEFSQDASTMKRFQQEANAVSKLTHPNLAAIYDQGVTASGAPYLVMGYIEGKGLDQILKEEHQLESTKAIDLFLQISESVQYAHEHGVVHRDLKPSNIIIPIIIRLTLSILELPKFCRSITQEKHKISPEQAKYLEAHPI
jgi:serine/threonine protein kinase